MAEMTDERVIINKLMFDVPGNTPRATATALEAIRRAITAALPPPQAAEFNAVLAAELAKPLSLSNPR